MGTEPEPACAMNEPASCPIAGALHPMIATIHRKAAVPGVFRHAGAVVFALLTAATLNVCASDGTRAEEATRSTAPMETRVKALIPELEAYIQSGMKAFDVPGLAIGIVTGDRLVYAKGFGVRSKGGGAPVDPRTVFQIGSATKGFLATTMAIAVDRGKFHWDDRVVDLDPEFPAEGPLGDARVPDVRPAGAALGPAALRQRRVGILGGDAAAMMRSLRHVEPVSSFRSTFAYTNITHILAGRIVAKAEAPAGLERRARAGTARPARHEGQLLSPPRRSRPPPTTRTVTAGRRPARSGPVHAVLPLRFRRRRRHQLHHRGCGALGAPAARQRQLRGAPHRLAREPRGHAHAGWRCRDKAFYAMGWVVQLTPNGNVVWHNGGTTASARISACCSTRMSASSS